MDDQYNLGYEFGFKEEKKFILEYLNKLYGQYQPDESTQRHMLKSLISAIENNEHIRESR